MSVNGLETGTGVDTINYQYSVGALIEIAHHGLELLLASSVPNVELDLFGNTVDSTSRHINCLVLVLDA